MSKPFVIPAGPLWEYIGDLSQDLLACSYNEDDIRAMWNAGTLDAEVARVLAEHPDRLQHYKREDGLYSDMLTAYVVRHQGWAPEWGTKIDPLTMAELSIIRKFRESYKIEVA